MPPKYRTGHKFNRPLPYHEPELDNMFAQTDHYMYHFFLIIRSTECTTRLSHCDIACTTRLSHFDNDRRDLLRVRQLFTKQQHITNIASEKLSSGLTTSQGPIPSVQLHSQDNCMTKGSFLSVLLAGCESNRFKFKSIALHFIL